MKTPSDFLARVMPPATPEDEAAARGLGVDVNTYRAVKLEMLAERARGSQNDITAEEAVAMRLRREPGVIKAKNASPNLFVQAAKTPGEVAKKILFVICYATGLAASVALGGERVQKIPGIFQCVLLGILILPSLWLTDRLWAAVGERARNVIRQLVRFWPLTLLALFFALVLLTALKRQLLH